MLELEDISELYKVLHFIGERNFRDLPQWKL